MARWISWKTNILNKAFYEPLHAGVAAFLRCVTIYDDSDDILGGIANYIVIYRRFFDWNAIPSLFLEHFVYFSLDF